ncbi:restriction endonuclease subunit S, partial [Bifidobacterium bifidum]
QPGVNAQEYADYQLMLPSKTEQQQIGMTLRSLDDLITLHQRKYDKLVVFKKSMLEKMFPKDGESVPEIRFAGFTDPWEQRKLGELEKDATLYMGRGRVISAKDMSNT